MLESLLQETRPDVAIDHFSVMDHWKQNDATHQVSTNEALPDGGPRPAAQPSEFNSNARPPVSPGISNSHDGYDDGNDLASDVALLALSASGREPHYFGPSSALSFSRVASSAMKTHKRHGGSQPSVYGATENLAPTQTTRPVLFPNPSVGHTLSAAYFNHVHPQYPFLHRPTFDSWQDTCLHAQQSGKIESVKDIPLFFVLMV